MDLSGANNNVDNVKVPQSGHDSTESHDAKSMAAPSTTVPLGWHHSEMEGVAAVYLPSSTTPPKTLVEDLVKLRKMVIGKSDLHPGVNANTAYQELSSLSALMPTFTRLDRMFTFVNENCGVLAEAQGSTPDDHRSGDSLVSCMLKMHERLQPAFRKWLLADDLKTKATAAKEYRDLVKSIWIHSLVVKGDGAICSYEAESLSRRGLVPYGGWTDDLVLGASSPSQHAKKLV